MMAKMQMKNKMQIKTEVEARMNTRTIIEIENSEIVSLKCSRIYTQKNIAWTVCTVRTMHTVRAINAVRVVRTYHQR